MLFKQIKVFLLLDISMAAAFLAGPNRSLQIHRHANTRVAASRHQQDGFHPHHQVPDWKKLFISSLLAASIATATPMASFAVSGGGLDYAGTDISGQDFSKSNYKGKDFTQGRSKKWIHAGFFLTG